MTDIVTTAQREYLTATNSALHEAGHLAAAIHCGIPAIAKIGWDGYSSGRTNYDPTGASLKNHLFIIFCGIAVTERFHLRKAGLALDLADIEKAVLPLPVAEAIAIKDETRVKSEEFVEQVEPGILRLAHALIEKRHLDEESAKEVFEGRVKMNVPEEFCEALRLLPRAVWQE